MFDYAPHELTDERAMECSRSILLAFMSDEDIPPVHRMTAAHELHKLIMISKGIKIDDGKPSKLKNGMGKDKDYDR